MAEIQSLQTPWEGHSGNEIEAFLKSVITSLQTQGMGKIGYYEYDGTTIHFYTDDSKQQPIGEGITIAGDVYKINITASEEATFNVLSSETVKALTFSASTLTGTIGGSIDTEYTEDDYTYVVAVDNGTGSFTQKQTGNFINGSAVTLNIRDWLTTGENRLRITVTGSSSHQQATKVFSVNMTSLYLECNFPWQRPWVQGDEDGIKISGIKFSGNLQKTLHVSIDNGDLLIPTVTFPIGTNYTSASYTFDITTAIAEWFEDLESSGIHEVDIWMEGGGVSTKHFIYNVMCVKSSEANTAKLICINNAKNVASNFVSEVLFQYAVYNITSVTFARTITDGTTTITNSLTADGLQTRTKNDYNSLIEFETQAMDGISLTIVATDGATPANVEEILEFPIDNSTAYLPTSGATFYMNAASRINGSEDRAYFNNQAPNAAVERYLGTWNGFSYGDTDGWTNDGVGENAKRALVVKAGGTISVPLLKPLGVNAREGSVTIEFKFKIDNIADYDTPIFKFGETDGTTNKDLGIYLYPSKLVVLGNERQDTVYQSIGLEEGRIHHIAIVFQKAFRYENNRNICTIYVNGIRSIHFDYSGTENFGDGSLYLGQASTDLYLYMMRFYERALQNGDVVNNFINAIIDDSDFTRSGVRNGNNIVDTDSNGKTTINYELAKARGYNIMVVETNNNIPDLAHQSKVNGVTLRMWYGNDNDSRNFSVTNCELGGQGTTSSMYYRWNLRFKAQDNSHWTYADYSSNPGKKGWFDGKNNHPQVADIVAKKNYASSMQGHKMGAVQMYNDLYMRVVGNSGLPSGARVAVYQYPVLGFQKFSDGTYQFIGLYTVGPHKGDKATFGYDKTTDYPDVMSLEGPNHGPLGTRFLHPWKNVDYSQANETLTFGGEEGWDCDFCKYETAYKSDKSAEWNAANYNAILALYISEWKPAYEIVFFCSPYLKKISTDELGESWNTLAKINNNVSGTGGFRSGRTGGVSNELFQLYDSSYNLYAYNNASHQYELLDHDMLDYLTYEEGGETLSYLTAATSGQPTTAEIIAARILKFRAEAGNYWSTDALLFHYCFCVLIGATDNFAKNMYPFKFASLANGGRWSFRQDDLDTILDTDNNGQQTKTYSILPGDVTGDGTQIFQGGNSVLYALVETAFADQIKTKMTSLVDAACAIGSELELGGDYTHEVLFNVFAHYFWDSSAKYFPAEAYNYDTEWAYIEPWFLNPNQTYNSVKPLTQARGDAQHSEREWVKKHIAFLFSRYLLGGFTGGSSHYGLLTFTLVGTYTFNIKPAIDLFPVINKGGTGAGGQGTNVQGARTSAGSICQIDIGDGSTDTITNILGTDWISELGDLCGMVTTTRGAQANTGGDLAFTGKRLRKVKVGDATVGNVHFNAKTIAFSGTVALEEFDARNVTTLIEAVDLSECKRIKKVLMAGCTAPGLILPEGARLTEISLPTSLSTLFLRGLPNLTYAMLHLDGATQTKQSIANLYVQNCPELDPIAILTDLWKAGGNLQYITLIWDEITGTKDYFTALYYIAQNKKCVSYSVDQETGETTYVVDDAPQNYGSVSYENGAINTVGGLPVIEGTVVVHDFISATQWEVVHETWPLLNIVADGRIIEFEDQNVKDICVAQWGGPVGAGGVAGVAGELTMEQAAKVSSIGTVFKGNTTITDLNPLRYFTLVTSLSNDVFNNCTSLKKVTLPPNVTVVNFYIKGCTSLERYIIPAAVKTINSSTIRDVGSNIRLIIGDPINGSSLNTVGAYWTFRSVKIMVLYATTPPSYTGSYQADFSSLTALYVPDESMEAYKSTGHWSKVASKIKPLSEYVEN